MANAISKLQFNDSPTPYPRTLRYLNPSCARNEAPATSSPHPATGSAPQTQPEGALRKHAETRIGLRMWLLHSRAIAVMDTVQTTACAPECTCAITQNCARKVIPHALRVRGGGGIPTPEYDYATMLVIWCSMALRCHSPVPPLNKPLHTEPYLLHRPTPKLKRIPLSATHQPQNLKPKATLRPAHMT